jgi:diaminopimelate decarboxylase
MNQDKTQTDRLVFGTVNPQEMLEKYGSPLYLYDEQVFRTRCREMKQLIDYPGFTANYSIKANSNLSLLRIAHEEGLFADAMSPGEIYVLEKAGFESERIFFIPNNVDAEEMFFALSHKVLISIDSLSQLALLGQIAPGSEVALRLNPGIGAGHHQKVVTAGKKTKFGIPEDQISQALQIAAEYRLQVVGINQHIGSLFMTPDAYVAAVQHFLELAMSFADLRIIDFGGGFGIPYCKMSGQPRLDLTELGQQLTKLTRDFANQYLKPITFKIEPGRYIVAESGVLVGRVLAEKNQSGTHYIGTDLGFNVLMRPILYDSHHDIELFRDGCSLFGQTEEPITVVGNICESGDILAHDRMLPAAKVGDIIVIHDAGAYGYAMSSNYNNRLRPAEVMITTNGQDVLIRRRETLDDLMSLFPNA